MTPIRSRLDMTQNQRDLDDFCQEFRLEADMNETLTGKNSLSLPFTGLSMIYSGKPLESV